MVIYKSYTKMHGQQNIFKKLFFIFAHLYLYHYTFNEISEWPTKPLDLWAVRWLRYAAYVSGDFLYELFTNFTLNCVNGPETRQLFHDAAALRTCVLAN